MRMPDQTKSLAMGAVGGAVAAMIVGFSWGGWVTGGTADKMASERTMTESVRVLTPFCVAEAKAEPERVKLLKAIDTYSRNQFIQDKTAWLVGMEKKYHYEVAGPCATKAVEAMEASAKPS